MTRSGGDLALLIRNACFAAGTPLVALTGGKDWGIQGAGKTSSGGDSSRILKAGVERLDQLDGEWVRSGSA